MEKYGTETNKLRNEQKTTETTKNVTKVVNGTVKTKKKSGIKKLADIFIAEDITTVVSYLLNDVLIPSAKKTLTEMIKNGSDMLINGETRSERNRSNGSRESYRSYYERNNEPRKTDNSHRRSALDYDDIVLETKVDAEDVLSQLDDLIANYNVVSVADLYQSVGIRNYPYTANDYGWTDLRNAYSMRVRDGYLLKLPKALPLN